MGVVIDRFGEDLTILKKQDCFEIHPRVMVSPQFYSWVFGFGGKMRILSPAPVVDGFRKHLADVRRAQG